MILQFPDTDTFRLAVTTGIVPADVVLAPARVSAAADGRLYVETDAKLTRKAADDLKRLTVVPAHRTTIRSSATAWRTSTRWPRHAGGTE